MAFISNLEVKNKTTNFKYRRAVFGYSLNGEGSEKYVEGLDIKFEVDNAGGSILPYARIDVCNLDTNIMKQLVTITPFDNNHRIALYAGYETNYNGKKNTSLPKIFEGRLKHAMFTYIPDVWLEMFCVGETTQMIRPMGKSDAEYCLTNIKNGFDLLLWVINEKLKMPAIYNKDNFKDKPMPPLLFNEGDKQKFQYNVGGKSPLQLIENLKKAYELKIFTVGDAFYITPNDRFISEAKKQSTVKWKINANTGMIGIPTVSVAQAQVKTLMNVGISGNDYVELYSKMYDNVYVKDKKESSNAVAANGGYTVTSVNHRGHLRGEEWYSTIKMVRGAY